MLDASGNGRHGTATGSMAWAGQAYINGGAWFDGIDDKIEIPHNPAFNVTNAMTVSVWVMPFRCGNGEGNLCELGYQCCNEVCGQTCEPKTIVNRWFGGDSWNLLWDNGQWKFMAVIAGVTRIISTPDTPYYDPKPQYDWVHLAAVYDGAVLRLYVNGTQRASMAVTGNLAPSSLPLAIGNRPAWNRFYGLIDDVRLYNVALSANQVRRLAHEVWPNVTSSANSDAWLSQYHDEIRLMNPVVLALDFVHGKTPDDMYFEKVRPIKNALREGSRYHAYANPGAEPSLNYVIRKIDMRTPPTGQTCTYTGSPACEGPTAHPHPWNHGPHYNTACYPRRGASFKYSELFSARFAQFYDIPSPDDGHAMSLCELVNAGMVHEVWMYSAGDNCDSAAAEVLEVKPRYDANRQKLNPVQLDWCAGNGCFSAQDQAEILASPGCANLSRSIRIGTINYAREVPAYMESMGHGFEQMSRANGAIPYLTKYFKEFAGFDLDTRYGRSFSSWYGFCNDDDSYPPWASTQCLYYTTASACAHSEYVTGGPLSDCSACAYRVCGDDPFCCMNGWDAACVAEANAWCPSGAALGVSYWRSNGGSGVIPNYRGVCGNAHFASNARNHYDTSNTQPIWTTCENYRLGNMLNGQDLATVVTNTRWSTYVGGWHQYWRQNMPGFGNPARDDSGQPMLSWWPFLYY